MTTQDHATLLLLQWQEQRRKGIAPEDRRLDADYEKTVDLVRQEMARTK